LPLSEIRSPQQTQTVGVIRWDLSGWKKVRRG
jgi:hypothetical protein